MKNKKKIKYENGGLAKLDVNVPTEPEQYYRQTTVPQEHRSLEVDMKGLKKSNPELFKILKNNKIKNTVIQAVAAAIAPSFVFVPSGAATIGALAASAPTTVGALELTSKERTDKKVKEYVKQNPPQVKKTLEGSTPKYENGGGFIYDPNKYLQDNFNSFNPYQNPILAIDTKDTGIKLDNTQLMELKRSNKHKERPGKLGNKNELGMIPDESLIPPDEEVKLPENNSWLKYGGQPKLQKPYGVVEAEGGEDVYRNVKGKWYHIKDIKGKSHEKGGEDVKLKDGDFVVPKDKASQLKKIYNSGNQFKLQTEFRKVQISANKKNMQSSSFIEAPTMEGGGMFSNAWSSLYNAQQYKKGPMIGEEWKRMNSAQYNPYESKAMSELNSMNYNADPMARELNRSIDTSYRAASSALYGNTNNASVARSNIAGAYGKSLDAKRTGLLEIRDREQMANNQYKSMRAQALDSFGQQKVAANQYMQQWNQMMSDKTMQALNSWQNLKGTAMSQIGASGDAGMQYQLDSGAVVVDAFSGGGK